MQGPRLASHHDGIELPDILPPKGKRATLRSAQPPPPEQEEQRDEDHGSKQDDQLKEGKEDLEDGEGGSGGGLSWLQRQRKLFMRHLAFVGPGELNSGA